MTVLRLGRTDPFEDKDSIRWNLGQNDKKEKGTKTAKHRSGLIES